MKIKYVLYLIMALFFLSALPFVVKEIKGTD